MDKKKRKFTGCSTYRHGHGLNGRNLQAWSWQKRGSLQAWSWSYIMQNLQACSRPINRSGHRDMHLHTTQLQACSRVTGVVQLTEANRVKHHNTKRGVFFHDRGVFRISLKKHKKKTPGVFIFCKF